MNKTKTLCKIVWYPLCLWVFINLQTYLSIYTNSLNLASIPISSLSLSYGSLLIVAIIFSPVKPTLIFASTVCPKCHLEAHLKLYENYSDPLHA
ncbi:hypothetical protein EV426DRAFT_404809 [Tirmania nivea]|nr:hypothetical protein EV426DRAFT_404809 [Tirmania nivea]